MENDRGREFESEKEIEQTDSLILCKHKTSSFNFDKLVCRILSLLSIRTRHTGRTSVSIDLLYIYLNFEPF